MKKWYSQCAKIYVRLSKKVHSLTSEQLLIICWNLILNFDLYCICHRLIMSCLISIDFLLDFNFSYLSIESDELFELCKNWYWAFQCMSTENIYNESILNWKYFHLDFYNSMSILNWSSFCFSPSNGMTIVFMNECAKRAPFFSLIFWFE